MPSTATAQPVLSPEEWGLIVHLLRLRQTEILRELRHTDTRQFREKLHKRLDVVESLLRRLPEPEP